MCFLSGRLDSSRTLREVIHRSEAAKRASAIIDGRVEDDWDFNVDPYRRRTLPPQVS